jgi:hypothetical protein
VIGRGILWERSKNVLQLFIFLCNMTAFSPQNLPPGVDTVEKLVFWGVSILSELNFSETVQTSAGNSEPAASAQTYRFPYVSVNPERLILTSYLPLTKGWRAVPKLWVGGVAELSQQAIPSGYLV